MLSSFRGVVQVVSPDPGSAVSWVSSQLAGEGAPREDVFFFAPSGSWWSAPELREVIDRSAMAPVGDVNVIVIRDADRIREQGMSLLLKTVEDPPGPAVFVCVGADFSSWTDALTGRVVQVVSSPSATVSSEFSVAPGSVEERCVLLCPVTAGWAEEKGFQSSVGEFFATVRVSSPSEVAGIFAEAERIGSLCGKDKASVVRELVFAWAQGRVFYAGELMACGDAAGVSVHRMAMVALRGLSVNVPSIAVLMRCVVE